MKLLDSSLVRRVPEVPGRTHRCSQDDGNTLHLSGILFVCPGS